MKKTTWIITLVAVLLLIRLAVFNTNEAGDVASEESIKVGALFSLTGKFATFGEDTKNGLELAREELKSQGINVEIVYEDAASDPKLGLAGANKLIDTDKVSVILASPGSSVNLAVAPELENKKTVFIVASATPKLNTAGEYIFKALPDIDPEVEMMIPYMISKKIKTLGILFDSASDTQVYAHELATKLFEKYPGTKVYSQGFDSKTADYRTQISQIKNSKPDAIYILSPEKGAGIAVKQIRELGLTQPIYGWSGIVGAEFFNGAGANAEGVVITDQPFSCATNELMKKYCADYKEKYPAYAPLTYGAHAYDVMKIIGSLLHSDPGLRGEKLKEAAMTAFTSKAYMGVSGDLSFDKEGNITRHEFVFRVGKDGTFTALEI